MASCFDYLLDRPRVGHEPPSMVPLLGCRGGSRTRCLDHRSTKSLPADQQHRQRDRGVEAVSLQANATTETATLATGVFSRVRSPSWVTARFERTTAPVGRRSPWSTEPWRGPCDHRALPADQQRSHEAGADEHSAHSHADGETRLTRVRNRSGFTVRTPGHADRLETYDTRTGRNTSLTERLETRPRRRAPMTAPVRTQRDGRRDLRSTSPRARYIPADAAAVTRS